MKNIVENFARNRFAWSSVGRGRPRTSHSCDFCCGRTGSVRKVSCTHTHTFVYQLDILNILCDYQFVFFVLDELCVSHHAWCSKWTCSKSAL